MMMVDTLGAEFTIAFLVILIAAAAIVGFLHLLAGKGGAAAVWLLAAFIGGIILFAALGGV